MRIDMKKLSEMCRGNTDARISLKKTWLSAVADMLDRLSALDDKPYDTTAIRMLSRGGDPKAVVSRKWLIHINETLLRLQRLERDTRTVEAATSGLAIPKGAQEAFDAAFSTLDKAFGYFDQGFSKMTGVIRRDKF